MSDYYDEGYYDEGAVDEGAVDEDYAAAVEQAEQVAAAAFEQALDAGADVDAVDVTFARALAEGLDPPTALWAASVLHDHSDAADEMDALRKISGREGWG